MRLTRILGGMALVVALSWFFIVGNNSVRVIIENDPVATSLTIDGVSTKELAPNEVWHHELSPGEHLLEATAVGGALQWRQILAVGDSQRVVRISLAYNYERAVVAAYEHRMSAVVGGDEMDDRAKAFGPYGDSPGEFFDRGAVLTVTRPELTYAFGYRSIYVLTSEGEGTIPLHKVHFIWP
jgi:hypothetical protein